MYQDPRCFIESSEVHGPEVVILRLGSSGSWGEQPGNVGGEGVSEATYGRCSLPSHEGPPSVRDFLCQIRT